MRGVRLIHPELSYILTGVCFDVANTLGRFCREKQYADALETAFKDRGIAFEREKDLPLPDIESRFTNRVDFVIKDTLLLEVKAKPFVTKLDYYQMQRYLRASGHDLGLIVNFRNTYLKPIRIIRIDS